MNNLLNRKNFNKEWVDMKAKSIDIKMNFINFDAQTGVTITLENTSMRKYTDMLEGYLHSVTKRNRNANIEYGKECSENDILWEYFHIFDHVPKNTEHTINTYYFYTPVEKSKVIALRIEDTKESIHSSRIMKIVELVSNNLDDILHNFKDIVKNSSEIVIDFNFRNITANCYTQIVRASLLTELSLKSDMMSLNMCTNDMPMQDVYKASLINNNSCNKDNNEIITYYYFHNTKKSILVIKITNNDSVLSIKEIKPLLETTL